MAGSVVVIGVGPGDERFLTREARDALDGAQAVYGFAPYLERLPERAGQMRHATEDADEVARAGAALAQAAAGMRVAMVSGGDPGVFALAGAVIEAIEAGPSEWRALDLTILPGITAMLAVAAKMGAPLGHDFCAISLSDLSKPWEAIAQRLRLAGQAGFAIAFYNPVCVERPWQLDRAFEVLREVSPAHVPVIFGRAVGRADERMRLMPLANARGHMADAATCIIIGTPETRIVERPGLPALVYTPRRD